MSKIRKKAKNLGALRSADRTKEKQAAFDIAAQLAALTKSRNPRRDPQRCNLKRERARPVCPLCQDIKVFGNKNGVFPLCIHCWIKSGRLSVEASKKLAAEAIEKRKTIDEPNPWGI